MENSKKKIMMIIVNSITLVRLIGALFLPWLYIKYGINYVAFVSLILFLTDAIDGFLARHFKVSTFFGSAMDALSDKVLNTISFILLILNYMIMACPLILELTVLFINYQTYRFGGNVQSSIVGKVKTIILDVFVILSFILLSLPLLNINNSIIKYLIHSTNSYITLFTVIIVIAELIAILDYEKKYKMVRSDPKKIHVKYQNRVKKTYNDFIHDIFDTEYYSKNKNESILKQLYK